MGLVADFATTLGIPVSGLAAAGLLYRVGIILEKEAGPGALADIARVLKSPSWSPENWPSRFIETIFKFTFGTRQLSITCVIRSAMASAVSLAAILLLSLAVDGPSMHIVNDASYCSLFASVYATLVKSSCSTGFGPRDLLKLALFLSIIPDYLSIAKTRVILRMIATSQSVATMAFLVWADILLCFWICWVVMTAYNFVFFMSMGGAKFDFALASWSIRMVYLSFVLLLEDLMGHGQGWSIYQWFIGSTVLTSIWTMGVLTSSVLLKLILPLNYLRQITVWFFDVDHHPIRAIGSMAAGLVFLASVAIAMIR